MNNQLELNKYEGHTPAKGWRMADGSAMFMQSANNNADAELMADAPLLLEAYKRLREQQQKILRIAETNMALEWGDTNHSFEWGYIIDMIKGWTE